MERRWLLAAGVALAAVAAGMWWGRGVEAPPEAPPAAPAPGPSSVATTSVEVVVHVSGWVASPGLVTLHPGARVGDALAAAGGARPGARLDAMNLARVLGDGQSVVVPGPGMMEAEAAPPADEAASEQVPVHVNSATAAQLESLPGVGPVLAERIVAHRRAQGAFERTEDLLEVAGIGEAKLASIRDLVAVP